MCGLAGILDFASGATPDGGLLQAMTDRLLHRGPDGSGIYANGPIGLAHRRLSIIGIEGGGQPIHNEDSTVWVAFNGEIFNYIELRAELIDAGHRFYTDTDTEVLVHLYEEHGPGFLERLNGQFAIALWDVPRQRLLLARDHAGILPLFYTNDSGRVLFASEVKALVPALSRSLEIDPKGIDQIMTFWGAVPPTSVFRGISQLQPGEVRIFDRNGSKSRLFWDWSFPTSRDSYAKDSLQDLTEQLRHHLIEATRIRLRADVPVGAYLSGGLDSSALTACMHSLGADLRTFSIQFDSDEHDESSHQQLMVRHLGANNSQVTCRTEDIAESFVRSIAHTESPILRTAPIPMALLSGLVRDKGYKVVLTGEGADEVLGGYDLFKETKIRQFWSRYPDSEIRPLLLRRLYPYLKTSPGQAGGFLQSFFGVGIEQPDLAYFSHLPRWLTTAKCKDFWSAELKAERESASVEEEFRETLPAEFDQWHPFNRAQYIEAKTLMSGYLLCSQGDRMLMSNSVEGRFPYLDHRLMEFANSLPPKLKMRGLKEKYLLKRATATMLPTDITKRHKQPYRAPDIPAFNTKTGRELVHTYLSDESIRKSGYFDPKRVQLLRTKAESGRALGNRDNMAYVAILSTQVWHDLFIDNGLSTIAGP